MRRQASKQGYLLIDHRASPGLTAEDMIRGGMDPTLAVGEGKMLEAATLTCGHCQGTVIKNPNRKRERAYCAKCTDYICDKCHGIGGCYTLEAVVQDHLGSDKPDNIFLLSPLLRTVAPKEAQTEFTKIILP